MDKNTLLQLRGATAKGYAFDRRYAQDVTSDAIYDDCVAQLVEAVFKVRCSAECYSAAARRGGLRANNLLGTCRATMPPFSPMAKRVRAKHTRWREAWAFTALKKKVRRHDRRTFMAGCVSVCVRSRSRSVYHAHCRPCLTSAHTCAGVTPRVIRHIFALADAIRKKEKPGEKTEVGSCSAPQNADQGCLTLNREL